MRVKPESRETATACVCPGSGLTPCRLIRHLRRAVLASARSRSQIDEPFVPSFMTIRVIHADRPGEIGGPVPTAAGLSWGESDPIPQGAPLMLQALEEVWALSTPSRILNAFEPG